MHNDIFSRYLKEHKLKFTPERKLILNEVFSHHTHFDADELYMKLRKKSRHISLASVYRTIPLLIESGLLKESLRAHGRGKYEHTFGHEHHDHMICIKCGRIIEFKENKIEKLQDEVCRKYSFKPTEHRLGIRGYCSRCRRKN